MENRQLSANFWLSEMVKSQTAERHGINNWPTTEEQVDKLGLLATNILQPVRDHYGIPFSPNSAYRCLELNRAIGSKDHSQHVKCEAVDMEVPGVSNYDLAYWISQNLEFDQLILEFYRSGVPSSGWVHVSWIPEGRRRQMLTINGGGAKVGLIE